MVNLTKFADEDEGEEEFEIRKNHKRSEWAKGKLTRARKKKTKKNKNTMYVHQLTNHPPQQNPARIGTMTSYSDLPQPNHSHYQ
jgi:hypothetical protein